MLNELLATLTLAAMLSVQPVTSQDIRVVPVARWCVINDQEMAKCKGLMNAINRRIQDINRPLPPNYIGPGYADLCTLQCVQGQDRSDCMSMIEQNQADLMQLETGLAYTAGQYYNMMPLVVEKYEPGTGDEGIDFLAVAVARKDNPSVTFKNLRGKKSCHTGVGQSSGWIVPVSTLMQSGQMEIIECNVPVKSAAGYFGDMCAPDGLARYYNPFGNNPVSVCKNCKGEYNQYCSNNDPYAGYAGAFQCMASRDGDIAFVRASTAAEAVANSNGNLTLDEFELVCPDNTRKPISESATCYWGKVPSHVVMTSAVRDISIRNDYKTFLDLLSLDFGVVGASNDIFRLFESMTFGKPNLIFTDTTKSLKDIGLIAGGTRDTYYSWAGQDHQDRLVILNSCPTQQARWCVISDYEMMKCEKMIMAFTAKMIKPDLNCIRGNNVLDCMQKIRIGDADLITLDAADVFIAGRDYNLVPIASEDYSGTESKEYYAVAVARRTDSFLTIFNLKQRRTCHPAVNTAAGWVVAVDKLVETGQISITDCNPYFSVGQYFSKSCVPGVLNAYYNPYSTNPVNLCEACGTGGKYRCERNDDELYFGASGAFRCLTEMGGDIAFVRHTTARENTDGRNLADWARNRRADDYELLCNDGTRKDIDYWADCNLGAIPSNAVVTAAFTSQKQREIFWTMLNLAQQFFAADDNRDFAMFDSFLNHKDLIFQDASVRLSPVPPEEQTYQAYLGPKFVRAMQRLKENDCITGGSSRLYTLLSTILIITAMVLV